MKPQILENYLPNMQEQLAGIFEARPSEELFSSEPPACLNSQNLSISTEPSAIISSVSVDPQQPQEIKMNTETPLYNYTSSSDPVVSETLTHRLYSPIDEGRSSKNGQMPAFEAVKHLIDNNSKTAETSDLKDDLSPYSQYIDQTIKDYHSLQSHQLSGYLERWLKRSILPDHNLYILHGWKTQTQNSQIPLESGFAVPFHNIPTSSSGGFYLRWNNTGIVINPGKNFLFHFHEAGLHIKDIDIVIVTNEDANTYTDIQEIYELNCRLNCASGDQQIIHYYLNQKAYQELSILLKPRSKSERNAIHCLELFAESPEVEHIKLREGILLNYFTNRPQYSSSQSVNRHQQSYSSNLGIQLELSKPQSGATSNIKLGYISGMGWSPFIGQHLEKCGILLAGIGNTNESDYNKTTHPDDCLGYYGTTSLLEETSPKLLICTEFGSQDGDLRLELIKKMRSEHDSNATVILPADIGMCIDLKTLAIKCSVTSQYTDPSLIKVTRPSGIFGQMHYLAPANYL